MAHACDDAQHGNVATAGDCLSAVYLIGWMVEVLFGRSKRTEALQELIPAGQQATFEHLIESSIRERVKRVNHSMDEVRVALVSQPYHESLVELLRELHAYYNEGSSVAPELVRAYLAECLLASTSSLQLVIATRGPARVLGFAAISLTYSLVEPAADKRRHCWLKELYVQSSSRSLGVGKALMSWVAQYAVKHGCRRIDWPVKASNARGIAFYEGLGAEEVVERLSYRLAEPHLSELARGSARAV